MPDNSVEHEGEAIRESTRIGLNVIALIGSRILVIAVGMVQAGVIFRTLGVEATGQYGFALGYTAMFTVFATLGINRLLMRDISRNPSIAWTYTWTAELVVLVMSMLVFVVVAGSIFAFESNPDVRYAVLAAALSVIVLWTLQIPLEGLLMGKEHMTAVALMNLVIAAFKLTSVIVIFKWATTSTSAHLAIALGNLIGFMVYFAVAIALVGWERPRIRLSLAVQQIRECLPFMAATLFGLVYFRSDMSILKFMRGDVAAGIYTPVQRIVEPIMMLASIWGNAVFPALCRFSVNAKDNFTQLKKTSLRFALLAAFPMAFGLALLATPVINILTGDATTGFAESVKVLQVMCFVVPIFYLNGIGQEFLFAEHKNGFIVKCYALGAVVSVCANVILIPRYGVVSVAYTAILANLIISIFFVRAMYSEFGSMRLLSLVLKTLVACACMTAAVLYLREISLVLAVLAGVGIYTVAQTILRTLEPEERSLIGRLLRNTLGKRNPTAS